MSAQLAAAEAELAGARGELGDVYAQWERDREELVEQIRWVGGRVGGSLWMQWETVVWCGCVCGWAAAAGERLAAAWARHGCSPGAASLPNSPARARCWRAPAPTASHPPPPTHTPPTRCPPSALHYNLALKALVIDAFVPQEEVAKVPEGAGRCTGESAGCLLRRSIESPGALRTCLRGTARPPALPCAADAAHDVQRGGQLVEPAQRGRGRRPGGVAHRTAAPPGVGVGGATGRLRGPAQWRHCAAAAGAGCA